MELTPGSWAGSGEDLIRHNSSEFKISPPGARLFPELDFLNVSWRRKKGVNLSLPLFFSMPIKCGIFEHRKTGVVGDLVTSQKLKF